MKTTVWAIVLGLTLQALAPPAFAKPSRLEGQWLLNQALTAEAQPEIRARGGRLDNLPRPTISVGGLPLPRAENEAPPIPSGSAADPKVLRSSALTIAATGDAMRLEYDATGGKASETLVRGNQQGLVSRWNATRMTSSYETLSRKVTQTFEVRKDGRLLVTVRLDPNDGRALVYKRVFDPAPVD
jgi:hypothetical protein